MTGFLIRGSVLVVLLGVWVLPAQAFAADVVSVDAEQAYEYAMAEDTFMLDVRTRAELQFVGAPDPLDFHVPFMEMVTPFEWNDSANIWRMEPNSDFVSDVDSALSEVQLGHDTRLIVICRSGSRSLEAARILQDVGYTDVIHVADGFEGDRDESGYRRVNGWLNADLPIQVQLPADRIYGGLETN